MEITTGLNVETKMFMVRGVAHYNSKVYASDGYCFYDKYDEIFDEEGNKVENPEPNQRTYMREIITPLIIPDEIKDRYIPVEIKPEYEVV